MQPELLLAMTIGASAVLISTSILWSSKVSQQDLSTLTDAVTGITTVAESAVALIGTIAAELQAAIDSQPEDDGAALQALSAKLTESSTELAAAVTANTQAPPPADATGGDSDPSTSSTDAGSSGSGQTGDTSSGQDGTADDSDPTSTDASGSGTSVDDGTETQADPSDSPAQ